MRSWKLTRVLTLSLAAALAAPAAFAYNIFLKDGSMLDARAKYQVQNGRAVILLRNGTSTFLPLEQIDIPRTEAANRVNYGSATVIETPKGATAPPPPQRQPGGNLGDLINRRGPAQPAPAPARPVPAPQSVTPAKGAKTATGVTDLGQLPRKPYPNYDIASAIQELFRSQGVELTVQTGTRGDRVFLEISTNSEGSVFQALETSAAALLHLRQRFPGKIAAFEVYMSTPAGERAGQFVITPDLADKLASKQVETAAFFLDNVQF